MIESGNLHFKAGIAGRLARFFASRKASRDPFEETVILPALLVVLTLRQADKHSIPEWTPAAAVLFSAICAGFWLGATLGFEGLFRIILRGTAVGIIEAACYSAYGSFSSAQPAIRLATDLAYLNSILFWLPATYAASAQTLFSVTEIDWNKAAPQRLSIFKILRGALGGEDLTLFSTRELIAARLVQWGFPIVVLAWVSSTFFGISPWNAIPRLLHLL